MDDIFSEIEATKLLSPVERRTRLVPFASKQELSRVFLKLREQKGDRRAMIRALYDLSTGGETRANIERYIRIHKDVCLSILSDEDAKTRKLSAELLGRLAADDFSAELMSALKSEETEFVKGSMILALGNARGSRQAVREFLTGYEIKSTDEKHRAEQELALKKALSSLADRQEAHISALWEGAELLLDCPSARVTINELKELGYEARQYAPVKGFVTVSGVKVFTDIYRARSFYTASVFYGSYRSDEDAFNAACTADFAKKAHALFGEELTYRVDVKCMRTIEPEGGKKEFAKKLSARLDASGRGYTVAPSSYLFSIGLALYDRGAALYITPSTGLDKRFEYKKESIAASVSPAAAAACVSFIKDYTYPDASVLDCFCGSGTMLFERSRLPYKALSGSDISPGAIKAAKLNEKEAKKGIVFFVKNAKEPFRDKYDEVICNLPFGLRVGSHEKNRELYKAFLDGLDALLTERGRAFLFTNDKKLLLELIPEGFIKAASHNFACGGLFPAMYVLTRK